MKRKLIISILALLFAVSSLGLVGCGLGGWNQNEKTDGHTHSYSSQWFYDDAFHWRVCDVKGCGKEETKQEHLLNKKDDDKGSVTYFCEVCEYTSTVKDNEGEGTGEPTNAPAWWNTALSKEIQYCTEIIDSQVGANNTLATYKIDLVNQKMSIDMAVGSTSIKMVYAKEGTEYNKYTNLSGSWQKLSVNQTEFNSQFSFVGAMEEMFAELKGKYDDFTVKGNVYTITNVTFENEDLNDGLTSIAIEFDGKQMKTVTMVAEDASGVVTTTLNFETVQVEIPQINGSGTGENEPASEGIVYTPINDGTEYQATSIGDWTGTNLVFPETYEGLPVTSIGANFFYGKKEVAMHLRSVTLSQNITEILGTTFMYCIRLTEIINKSSIEIVVGSSDNGAVAAYATKVLTATPTESNFITSGDYVFYNADTEYYLVDYVGDDSELVLPTSFEGNRYSIRENALYGISQITDVTIGAGVKEIGSDAFGATGLESVVIPNTVTSMGRSAFANCVDLTTVDIGTGIDTISAGAFSGCSSLDNVVLPNNVLCINGSAFLNCTGLTSITIPYSVTSIGSWVFRGCTSLTSINVDVNNANYCSQDGVLYNKDKTSLICYPAGKSGDFTIPDSVTTIGSYAFLGCSSLTGIILPDSVISIGDMAFYDCSNLTSVYYEGSATDKAGINIGFSNTRLTNAMWYYISEGVEYTISETEDYYIVSGIGTFRGTELVISPIYNSLPVTTIGASAFYTDMNGYGTEEFVAITGLTSVILPEGITTIETGALSGCFGVLSITIPSSVTSIGEGALPSMRLIEVVNKSQVEIDVAAYKAMLINFAVIENEEDTNIIRDGDWYFYNDNGEYCLIAYRGTETNLALPDNINGNAYSIRQSTFMFCGSITSVVIPDTVTAIGHNAFYACVSMTSITIGSGVEEIGDEFAGYVFFACPLLESATFNDPEGWSASGTPISSDDLSNTATAAEYIKETYFTARWIKNVTEVFSF